MRGAGVYTVTIAEAVDVMEQSLNSYHAARITTAWTPRTQDREFQSDLFEEAALIHS